MSALLLAALLAAPCEAPGLEAVAEGHQEAACALLARPPSPTLEPGPLAPLYEQPGFERARLRNTGALKALLAQLQRWFNQLAETSGAQTYSNVTRVLVLAGALAVAGALLLRRGARRDGARGGPPTPAVAALALDDPGAHLGRAERLLAAAPREAIREGLLALLSSLERRRFARPDRVKTNQELADELPSRGAPPALVARVAPLFAWFDRAFYSLGEVPAAEARRFLDDVRRVAEEAP